MLWGRRWMGNRAVGALLARQARPGGGVLGCLLRRALRLEVFRDRDTGVQGSGHCSMRLDLASRAKTFWLHSVLLGAKAH